MSLLAGCVTLNELINLSVLQFSSKIVMIIKQTSNGVYEDKMNSIHEFA